MLPQNKQKCWKRRSKQQKSPFGKYDTLPETNRSHLKIGDWNTILSFWEPLFPGAFAIFAISFSGALFQRIKKIRSRLNLWLQGIIQPGKPPLLLGMETFPPLMNRILKKEVFLNP